MDQPGHPGPAHPCPLCADDSGAAATICAECERTYGRRVARLLARAESDRDFAAACLANFPPALRERFAHLLARRCLLPGADTRQRPGLRAARPRVDPDWLRRAN